MPAMLFVDLNSSISFFAAAPLGSQELYSLDMVKFWVKEIKAKKNQGKKQLALMFEFKKTELELVNWLG